MEKLNLEGSRTTVEVSLDPDGMMIVRGNSTPENSAEFFMPLIRWAEDYVPNAPAQTRVQIRLEYTNSSSAKYLFEFLRRFSKLKENGKALIIEWYYEEDDLAIQELGEEFNEELDISFEFVAFQED